MYMKQCYITHSWNKTISSMSTMMHDIFVCSYICYLCPRSSRTIVMNMIGTCYICLYFAHDQDQCPVVSSGVQGWWWWFLFMTRGSTAHAWPMFGGTWCVCRLFGVWQLATSSTWWVTQWTSLNNLPPPPSLFPDVLAAIYVEIVNIRDLEDI